MDEEEFDEDELFQSAADMYEKNRPERSGFIASEETYFKVAMRADRGSWQGQVRRPSLAQQWCMDQGLQQTQRFPIYLGLEEGKIIGQAWAHRMDFMYSASLNGLMDTEEQIQRTMEAYAPLEPREFSELMETAAGRVLEHGLKVRALTCRVVVAPLDDAGAASSSA